MCQLVGKPNHKVPVAPLQPILAVEEPFSRVIMDYVGPLPQTKAGNQYLLTVMCASSRFSEANPLCNIKAKNTVKALITFLPWWNFRGQYSPTRVLQILCLVYSNRLCTS